MDSLPEDYACVLALSYVCTSGDLPDNTCSAQSADSFA